MKLIARLFLFWLCAALSVHAAEAVPPASYDPALAKQTGANEQGMRKYVLVILKTGPNKVPAGPARDEMFKGHFSNMKRLAAEGVLAHAGPLDGVDGWRGLFILAVDTIDEARKHVATDPVIVQGEMVAEYHTHYGSAALMLMSSLYPKVARQPM
ncbi:YciI family protein [Chitinimonas sp. BJYL2]|uniref:YciI family protein n=1 Tax=Chitinimonas sp. BJYL2 TaxID=2976696 RepID=UPI0022B306D1|nr:YciI family protein [Chitinimonas sp. BJYL2]